jgi:hypothetical protein
VESAPPEPVTHKGQPSAQVEASAAPEGDEAPAIEISVSANLPMRELRIGKRIVAVQPASTSAKVALQAEEMNSKLVARAADGRLAAITLRDGQREIALQFAAAPARGPRPPAGPKPAPLAPSPYDQ